MNQLINPAFILAFAYDPEHILPELEPELRTIQQLLTTANSTPDVLWKAQGSDIESRVLLYQERLRLFHYSGHAGKSALFLNSAQGTTAAFAPGLAGLVRIAPNLKLVFLNGCSTDGQAQAFLQAGAHCVIATTRPIKDRYALSFATRFYRSFTNANAKLTLQAAFDMASNSYLMDFGPFSAEQRDEDYRSGNLEIDEPSPLPLFQLQVNPSKKEIVASRFEDWFKPDADEEKAQKIAKIRDLISRARLQEAILLYKTIQSEQGDLLLGQYNTAHRQNMLGIYTGDYNQHLNRLSYNLLNLLNDA